MFKMYWWTIVAILLVALFFEGNLAQRPSDIEENKKIEARHNCKCVKYYLCDDSNNVDIYGDNIFEPRISAAKIPCKGAYVNELLCCKVNNTVTTVTDRGPVDDISPSTKTTCGTIKTALIPRILTKGDDLDAIDGEFPWIVAIFDRNSQFQCGGTLIHPKVVLTANHCIYGKRPNFFAVGANGKIDLPKDETSKKYVSEIISHPRYAHTGRLYNDAALLILETPFVDENLNTLCLPPQNFDLEGQRCIVAGWGRDNNGQRREKLKRVEVPFVSHSQCDTLMRNSRLGRNFRLHSSFMCAGGEEGKDACIGDGGGALLCEMSADPQQFFQKGIVSWGIGCGLKDVPGVYTDVEKISNWIKDELRTRNLNI